jgi:hypothetical protein
MQKLAATSFAWLMVTPARVCYEITIATGLCLKRGKGLRPFAPLIYVA